MFPRNIEQMPYMYWTEIHFQSAGSFGTINLIVILVNYRDNDW